METAVAKTEAPAVDANQTPPSLNFTDLVAAIKTANRSPEQSVENQGLNDDTLVTKPEAEPKPAPGESPVIPLEGFIAGTKISGASVDIVENTNPEALTPKSTADLPTGKTAETMATPVLVDIPEQKSAPASEPMLAAKPAPDLVPNTTTRLQNTDPASKQPAAPLAGLSALPLNEKIPALPQETKSLDLSVYKQDIAVKQIEQTPPVAPQKVQSTATQTTHGMVALPASLEIGQMASPDLFLAQPELGRMGALHAVSSTAPAAQGDAASLNVAKTISQQILVQISKTADPRIEIRLDPPELGRVVVNMVTTDSGVYATVSAERPEIIELMRRNADILAAAFEKAGFGQADLHFQSDQDRQFSDENDNQSDTRQNQAGNEIVLKTELTYLPGDRLDIRL
ncbi:MAG: flagellar hook-length control protein FliK [Rhodobacteraceae bacterium]|nr:flagellar hook-length control protein FliK [Paracoccaceae bacterium]